VFRFFETAAIGFVAFLVGASVARADLGDCLQPTTTGPAATIRDCLYILQASVGGSVTCETPCICDADADDAIDATDALVCLRAVIGLPTSDLCGSCGTPAVPFTVITRGVAGVPADEYGICPTELGFTIVVGEEGKGWVSLESPFIVPYIVEVDIEEIEGVIHVNAPDVIVSDVFQSDPYYIVDVGWHDLELEVHDTNGDGIEDTGSGSVTVTCEYYGVLVTVDDASEVPLALAQDDAAPALALSPDQGLQPLYTFRDAVTVNASRPLLHSTLASGLTLLVNGQSVQADVEPFGVSGPFASGATLDPVPPLPFDATIGLATTGVTDALGRAAGFNGNTFQTVPDPGPLTSNSGFENEQGWIGLHVGSFSSFAAKEGQRYALVPGDGQLFGYFDVPVDATTLKFWAGLHEYLGCGGRPAEVTLESAAGESYLFPTNDIVAESCDDTVIGSCLPWTEISTDLESLRGQRVVFKAKGSRFTECAPDLYEEVVLDDFRIE